MQRNILHGLKKGWVQMSLPMRASSASNCNRRRPDNDPFRLFQLQHHFSIDHTALHQSYREKMKELHPDRHQQKSRACQVAMEQQAAEVTAAYDLLKRPFSRATALLEALGHPIEDEATTGASKLVDAETLLQVMEIREQISEATNSKDTDPTDTLRGIHTANVARTEDTCEQLEEAILASDFGLAQRLTAQLQYWNRIDETLREAMSVS